MGGSRHEIAVGHGIRVKSGDHKSRRMRYVRQQKRPALIRYTSEFRVVHVPRVSAPAGDYESRGVFQGTARSRVETEVIIERW